MQQIEAKYEEEKRRALLDIEQYKKRCSEREEAIQAAANRQISTLTEQVGDLNRLLKDRLWEVEELDKSAKQQIKVRQSGFVLFLMIRLSGC